MLAVHPSLSAKQQLVSFRYPYILTNIPCIHLSHLFLQLVWQNIHIYLYHVWHIFFYSYRMLDFHSGEFSSWDTSSAWMPGWSLPAQVTSFSSFFLTMLDPFLWLWYWSRRSVVLDPCKDFCVIVNWLIDKLIVIALVNISHIGSSSHSQCQLLGQSWRRCSRWEDILNLKFKANM